MCLCVLCCRHYRSFVKALEQYGRKNIDIVANHGVSMFVLISNFYCFCIVFLLYLLFICRVLVFFALYLLASSHCVYFSFVRSVEEKTPDQVRKYFSVWNKRFKEIKVLFCIS